MPKAAKKNATKKAPAKTAKKQATKRKTEKNTSSKKAPQATSPSRRTRAVTATPARIMSRRSGGKSEITAVIGSVTAEDVAVRAYFIGERRRSLGLPGDPESDWLEAERQLRV
jgi:hypothetical protein